MAADKTALINAIKNAMDATFTASTNAEGDVNAIRTQHANALADAIEDYVKTISITIGVGVIVVSGPGGGGTNTSPIEISNQPPNSIS